MRKVITVLSFTLGLFVSVATFSACSSSDDSSDDKGGGEKPSINKRLVKETKEREGSIRVNEYTYDNDGKVIQVKYNITYRGSLSQDKPESTTSHNITYSDNSILEVTNNGGKCEYILENGLIVKEIRPVESNYASNLLYSWTYTYDNNNYLATATMTANEDNLRIIKYIWSGGNLIRKEEEKYSDKQIFNKDISTYEYSSISAPPNFIFDDLYRYIGHSGNSSKNLPSKIVTTGTAFESEKSYEWVIENGLPVKLVIMEKEKEYKGSNPPYHYYTYTYTFEWK